MHIRQPEIPALKPTGSLRVIKAGQVQQGGVQSVELDRIARETEGKKQKARSGGWSERPQRVCARLDYPARQIESSRRAPVLSILWWLASSLMRECILDEKLEKLLSEGFRRGAAASRSIPSHICPAGRICISGPAARSWA